MHQRPNEEHVADHRRAKKVAMTLYYLSDEGRLWKSADAFGIAQASMSIVLRRTCKVITTNHEARDLMLKQGSIITTILFNVPMIHHGVWEPSKEHTSKNAAVTMNKTCSKRNGNKLKL